mgnify:FL=1
MRTRLHGILKAMQLARQAFGPYKPHIILLSFLSFISGALEGIGVNAVIPLLAIVTGASSGGNDSVSKAIEQFFIFLHIDFSVKSILIFIAILFVFKTLTVLAINYVKIHITSRYEQEIRSSLFQKMLMAQWGYLLKQKLGHLETVLMTNVRFGSELLGQISEVIITGMGLLIYSVIAINISTNITLVALSIGVILLLILKPILNRTRQAALETSQTNKRAAHFINENMVGMKTIKTTNSSETITYQGVKIFELFRKLRIRTMILKSVGGSLFQPISIVFVCVVFGISYKLPDFSFITFVAVVYLIQRIFSYTQQLQGNLQHMTESVPYLRNILEYEKEANINVEQRTGAKEFVFNNDLVFNRVGFAYDSSAQVLKDVSFRIPKGTFYGIVGSSGSGKTTLVDLLLRLFSPTTGSILLDGISSQGIDIGSWRGNIGYVSQDMFLINDTIANNIRFYGEFISDKDVIEAAKMAYCFDFINALPNGFETLVGERGVRLSAGQRQRIVIARALVRKPKFLILDEATSALDNESESQIQHVIESLKHKMTVLVIAHRLSTIMNSDMVIVLDNSEIVEKGDPKRLLDDSSSVFYKLYNAGK